MSSTIQRLTKNQHINPPSWLVDNVRYETLMGSQCYGVSVDTSDWDMVGFCVPPKDIVFPHLAGIIQGFGRQVQKFVCYQRHHVKVPEERREYDLNCYNIVHYFHLCMDNNPNMIDTLFVPRECIIHSSQISEMVRERRHLFLHKGAWYRFKGYAYAQLSKMTDKKAKGKRAESIAKHGYDVKNAYHLVRLLDEIEQILTLGDIDLRRNKEHLKAIRRGEVPKDDIIQWATEKENYLEEARHKSKLPERPDEEAIKQLLMECLEEHFGNLDGCVHLANAPVVALRAITAIIDRSRGLIS
jgi:predicted nucleotidyltransferase